MAKAEGNVLKVPTCGRESWAWSRLTKDVSPAFTAAIPSTEEESWHLVAEKMPQLSSGLSPSSP